MQIRLPRAVIISKKHFSYELSSKAPIKLACPALGGTCSSPGNAIQLQKEHVHHVPFELKAFHDEAPLVLWCLMHSHSVNRGSTNIHFIP